MRLPWGSSIRTGLANGSSTVVATVTGLLLAFVAASAVLCGVASGSAAIAYQSTQGCARTLPVYVAATSANAQQTARIAADSRRVAAQQGQQHSDRPRRRHARGGSEHLCAGLVLDH